ncbi:MAG: MerC domain-containing protein [Bacteroidetes bacterium]|nr:MerC domain-containing protein [Bacteroidota bacterium]
MSSKVNWDALGITTSILCAIHCAILPLAVATLPVLGVNIIHNALFEYGMILLAFAIGTRALWHGFSHHHRRLTPWFLFLGGIILLIAKQVWHTYEFRFLPFAVGLIVTAHVLNLLWTRSRQIAPPAAADSDVVLEREAA